MQANGPTSPPNKAPAGRDPLIARDTSVATVTNLSAAQAFSSLNALSTSNQPDAIGLANPFVLDGSSSAHFQTMTAPNIADLRNKVVHAVRACRNVSEALARQQTGNNTASNLLSGLAAENEMALNAPILRVRSASFLTTDSVSQRGDIHYGVRVVLTNRRLVFIDSTVDKPSSLQKMNTAQVQNSKLNALRRNECYSVTSSITDDVWFKPVPLQNITSVEFHASHRTTSSANIINRANPGWIWLLIGGLSIICFGLAFSDPTVVVSFAMIGTAGCIGALYLQTRLARANVTQPTSFVSKSRSVFIGYFDSLWNTPLIARLEIEDTQQLSHVVSWISALQSQSPQLEGSQPPLLAR